MNNKKNIKLTNYVEDYDSDNDIYYSDYIPPLVLDVCYDSDIDRNIVQDESSEEDHTLKFNVDYDSDEDEVSKRMRMDKFKTR